MGAVDAGPGLTGGRLKSFPLSEFLQTQNILPGHYVTFSASLQEKLLAASTSILKSLEVRTIPLR